jgi:putative ABC transport system permease protein
MVLFVFTMNLVHSLDVDSLLQEMNLFADIEIASEDVLNGMESGILPDVQALPSGLRDQLEQVCNKMDVTYHYNLDAPTVLYGDDAEEYSKIILDSGNYYGNNGIEDDDIYIQRANAFRKGDNAILLQQSYRFYDYEQMEDFEIFEGSIDKAKFESGEYVIAVALTGEGDSYYHVGDVVSLYDEFPDESAYNYEKDENGRYTFFDQLATKKYTVMAVVSDKYQNLMNGGNSCQGNLEYIFPTKSMEYMSETPDLFMITMDAPDNKTLQTVEPLIQTCLNSMGGEDVVSYRSRGVYKSQLDEFGRMIALIGNGLALVVGLMSLVNFLNSCISGIAERREEFATLQAIGMTKEKLIKVVRRENLYTILLAVIPGYVIGHLLSAILIQKASESIEYVAWNITLLPGLVLALGITLLSMVYPNRKTDIGDRKY